MRLKKLFWLPLIFPILTLLVPVAVHAQFRVAVIDGFLDAATATKYNIPLCKDGLRDFRKLKDSAYLDHASNVAALITQYAGPAKFCIIHYPVHTKNGLDWTAYFTALIDIIKSKNIDIVNLSMAGKSFSATESDLLLNILKNNTVVAAAAGNEGLNLDKTGCIVYPACVHPSIFVIGANIEQSNYGSVVDLFEYGSNMSAGGVTLSGTSQATAVFTGNLIRFASEKAAK